MELRNYTGIGKSGEKIRLTIASGPVIIENNKVLLVKHGKDDFWKFPGGTQLDTTTFIENAKREVKEELDLEIKLKNKEPCILVFEREKEGIKEYVTLFHYLAERIGEPKQGKDIREVKWIEITNLPNDCAPNIKPVLNHFSKTI